MCNRRYDLATCRTKCWLLLLMTSVLCLQPFHEHSHEGSLGFQLAVFEVLVPSFCLVLLLFRHSVMSGSLQPHRAPLSVGFSRQEDWSGEPLPPPGGLLDPGVEPPSPAVAQRLPLTGPFILWSQTISYQSPIHLLRRCRRYGLVLKSCRFCGAQDWRMGQQRLRSQSRSGARTSSLCFPDLGLGAFLQPWRQRGWTFLQSTFVGWIPFLSFFP